MSERKFKRKDDSAVITNKKYGTKELSKLLLDPNKTFNDHVKRLNEIDKKKDALAKKMLKSTKDLINWVNIRDEYEKAFFQIVVYIQTRSDEVSYEEMEGDIKKYEKLCNEFYKDKCIEEAIIYKNKAKIQKLIAEPSLAVYRRWFDYKYFRNEHHLIDATEQIAKEASWGVAPLNDIFKVIMRYDLTPYGVIQDSKGNVITNLEELTLEQYNDPKFWESYYKAQRNGLDHHLHTFAKLLHLKFKRVNQELRWLEHNSRFEKNMHGLEIDPKLGLAILFTSSMFKDIFCKYREINDRLIAKQMGTNQIKPWNRIRDLKFKKIHCSDDEAIQDATKCLSVLNNDYISIFSQIIREKWINWHLDPQKQQECSLSGGRGTAKFPIYLNWNHQTEGVMSLVHEVGHSVNAVLSKGSGINSGIVSLIAEIPGFVNEALLFCYYMNEKYSQQHKGAYFTILHNYLDRLYNNICENVQYELACVGIENFFRKNSQFSFEDILNIFRESCDKFGGLTKDEKQWLSDKDKPESKFDYYDLMNVFGAYDSFKTIVYFLGAVVGTSIGLDLYYNRDKVIDKYMDFLQKGNTSDPVKALKDLGYDITKPETYKRLAEWINKLVDLLAQCEFDDPLAKPKEKTNSLAGKNAEHCFVIGQKTSGNSGSKTRRITRKN